jgi:hypothetical protein
MPKTENIIRHLPEIYGAHDRETVLFKFIDTFGRKLQEIEDNMVEIMRSHWVDHAATMDTLTRLGTLYDIRPREGKATGEEHIYVDDKDTYDLKRAVVRKIERITDTLDKTGHEFEKDTYTLINGKLKWIEGKSKPDDNTKFYVDYSWLEELGVFRRRLKETIKTYLNGVGTVETIKKIVTTTLNIKDIEFDDPRLQFRLIEFPLRLVVSEEQKVSFGVEWSEVTRGFGPGDKECEPIIQITGIGERTANPVITNTTTGVQVLFEGIVPDGKVLTITPEGIATLDGRDVSDYIHMYKGSQFNHSYFGETEFAVEYKGTPSLPRGISTWRYSTEDAVFANGGEYPFSLFNRALFGPISEVVSVGPVAKVQLRWFEKQLATFIIKIPWYDRDSKGVISDTQNVRARHEVKAAVDKVKAAGVRGIIDYFEELEAEKNYQNESLSFGLRTLNMERNTLEDRISLSQNFVLSDRQTSSDKLIFLGVYDMSYFDGNSVFN